MTACSKPHRYCLFDTPIGRCGVAWKERGLTRLQLPESDGRTTERRLQAASRSPCPEPSPPINQVIAAVERYLGGRKVDFSSVADAPLLPGI